MPPIHALEALEKDSQQDTAALEAALAPRCCKRHASRYGDCPAADLAELPDVCVRAERRRNPPLKQHDDGRDIGMLWGAICISAAVMVGVLYVAFRWSAL